jgi:dipeptidyl aminopeptidase/acylaminoacyl peptidase
MRSLPTPFLALAAALVFAAPATAQQRPLTFMDVQELKNAGSWTPSPDGSLMLYTIRTPDWQDAESQTDIHLVSLTEGVSSSRQLTYTDDKNETQPTWGPDGSYFVFASNRDAGSQGRVRDVWGTEEVTIRGNQLYLMRHDGGEAQKITSAAEGVSGFDFSPDGRWLVYRSGDADQMQLFRIAVADLMDGGATQITSAEAGVEQWDFTPDGDRIFFVRADYFDADAKQRVEEGFTVDVKNDETPLASLWSVDVASAGERRETSSGAYSVDGFSISPDGRWIGFSGGSTARYERNITQARLYADQYLLELSSGDVERITDNFEISESRLSFSPDGRWVAFSGPDDMDRYAMTENRIYVREAADRGGDFRKIGSDFDQSLSIGFWSEDGSTIYFNAGVKVTTQLHAVDIRNGDVRQLTHQRAALNVSRDEDTDVILIGYSDPQTPPTVFTTPDLSSIDNQARWTQLVDANPHVADIALGREVEINWTSTDGKTVGGVLVYPVGYQEGTRYPLIVAIHGGPASADVLRFNGGYSAQVYAGEGYAVLKPNYRGSRNYGNAHRTDIVGDYFTLGFDDIMTGVDYLIDEGIADPDQMGALGWSAGGHWSNWILTHTDRFKAISSGAGTMNWISMYAQSDVQRNRQYYVGDGFLYEDFDTYFDQSPLKYITNAETPTMIHVVEGDPRVPSPQSVELHMALKKLDVPTELFMYPGRSHGIPGPRNRLVKAVSEMAWMDHYVRGIGDKFEWRQVLATLEKDRESPRAISDGR